MVSKAVIVSAGLAALSWLVIKKLRGGERKSRARRVRRPEALKSTAPDEISIVVYNVLADHYCTPKRYPYVRQEWLQWPQRWKTLQEQLSSFGSDLICLQEVEPSRWEEILASPALSGYAGMIQDRRGGESLIANAILYRTDKLGLFWQESRSRALLGAFVFWDGLGQQQLLYVANLHLEGSPYRPNDRISQTRSALQRMEAHQRTHGIAPEDAAVVVCGDFNSGRHETVCQFLHRGRLEGGTTEPHMPRVEVTKTSISHPYALHEAYSSGGHELPFTRKVQSGGGPGTVDMMLRWPRHVEPLPLLWRLLLLSGPPTPAPGEANETDKAIVTAIAAAGGQLRALSRAWWWWWRRHGRRRRIGWPGRCRWRGPRVPALASTLDFIWASYQLEVAALYWPVELRHEGLIQMQALPNQHYPSDHLPIGAVLRLKHFYEPPFGGEHPPEDPPEGVPPEADQDYSAGQESDATELGLGPVAASGSGSG